MAKQKQNPKAICCTCGGELKTPFVPWVDAQTHPTQRRDILSGAFFRGKCRKCGKTAEIKAPCLYYDSARAAMIYLIPDFDGSAWLDAPLERMYPETADIEKRVVSTVFQLKEKILLLETGLDDRSVELTKLAIAGWASQRQHRRIRDVYFAELDETQNRMSFYLYDGDREPILYRARTDIYRSSEEIIRDAGADERAGFCHIDLRWAAYTLASYHRRKRAAQSNAEGVESE